MTSKQVTDRQKSTRAVVAAAESNANDIASHVSAVLKPHLRASEKLPDIALLVNLVGRALQTQIDGLVAADSAHEAELSDDAAPREARDAAAKSVREVLVDARAAIEATFGTPALAKLGFAGAIPTDPQVLSTLGGRIRTSLEDASIKMPAPRRKGLKVDRSVLAADLADTLPALDKALAKVATEVREAEGTLSNKRKALESSDRLFSSAATWIQATCALGGLDDLAERVRPSGRHPGETAVLAPDPAPPPVTTPPGPAQSS